MNTEVKAKLEMLSKIANKSLNAIAENKYLPYVVCLIFCAIFYITATTSGDDIFKGLVINISSAFISIPILQILYEEIKKRNERKRYKTYYEKLISELRIEIEHVLKRIWFLVFPYSQRMDYKEDMDYLMQAEAEEIGRLLETFKFIGFKVHQKLGINSSKLSSIACNRIFLRISKINDIDKLEILCSNLETLIGMYAPSFFTIMPNEYSCWTDNLKIDKETCEAIFVQPYVGRDPYKDTYKFSEDDLGYIRHCYTIDKPQARELARVIREILDSIQGLHVTIKQVCREGEKDV